MSQVLSTSISSPDFDTIFAAALKEYKKRTKKDITAHPLAAKLKACDSPNAVLTVLQSQVQTFDQSEGANERWAKLLDPTVNVLYAFSGFISNVTGPIIPPVAATFAGIGVLLQAVKDVRASQDILIDLFGRMEFFFKRLEIYIKVRPTAGLTDIIVKIVVEVISILGVVTKEMGQGRTKKYLKTLFGIKRVEDAFQRLESLMPEEARMATAENLTIAHRIDENVIRVGESAEGVKEGMQRVEMKVEDTHDQLQIVQTNVQVVDDEVGLINNAVTEARVAIQLVSKQISDLARNKSHEDLRQWIAPPDPSSNFETASEAHHEGTAAWCTKGNTFVDWATSGSLLWIHGKPGSGKTVLSSAIIREIKSMFNTASAFLAYFYFDFKDTGKQDPRALLSSLLVQLSNQSEQLADVLRGSYSEHQEGLQKPNCASLFRCLERMLTIAGQAPVYLVMDALDECPNDLGFPSPRENVLELVEKIVDLRHPNLRLCVTSRPEFDIRTTLEPLATQQISLHDENGQKEDIVDYVTYVVRSDKKMKRWRDDEKTMVVDKLTEKADGMFRWVFCQLEVLRHCFPNNLRRVLKELPQSLDETYRRILKEIDNTQNHQQAHRLLQCLVVAIRPLRVEELAEVLALDFIAGGIPKFNPNWRWENHEEAVLSACSSLVSVIIDEGSRIVQFSHFSVKEFLTSNRLASMEEVSQFHIAIEPSHAILSQACLGVFLSLGDGSDEDTVENMPLYRYALGRWYFHARIGNVESQIKNALDYVFDVDRPHFGPWIRMQGIDRLDTAFSSEDPNGALPPAIPLYLATSYGICGLTERLIIKQPQAVHFCGNVGTPLHISVMNEQIEVARLLITHGADINSRSRDNSTPLHFASRQGHLDIGKWLLNCGADPNSQDESGRAPLHLATFNGDLEICRILLEHNADVHVRDNRRDTPLHFAASEGHLEVARILLQHNAELNSQNDEGSTPFLKALERRNFDIVRLLLEHNTDLHVHDNSGNTPLHFAASGADLKIARILIEHNAQVDSRNGAGSTPFLRALESDDSDIALLLLGRNVDVHVHNNRGNTPLHLAASGGHLEVARILLKLKADVNSLNDEGSTPLHQASHSWREGNPDLLRHLLDHGADVNKHDKRGNTPLHFAASRDDISVVRILLEHNAQVDSRNGVGSTPLLRALEHHKFDIARLLLDHKVDVNAHDDSGNTPLYFAVSGGHLEVARMLLGLKAEVNIMNDEGLTPLHRASQEWRAGNHLMVRLLLDYGADVNMYDNRGNTPLHFAASRGHVEVAHMLLELKAEVNILNDEGLTPLHRASQAWWGEGNIAVVQLLIDYGADVHVHDNSGNTPLHFAASQGHLNIACKLLDVKAEVNALNDEGSTPLHRASDCYLERNLDIVRLLLDHGGDVKVRNVRGMTASELAHENQNDEIVRLLSQHAAK